MLVVGVSSSLFGKCEVTLNSAFFTLYVNPSIIVDCGSVSIPGQPNQILLCIDNGSLFKFLKVPL